MWCGEMTRFLAASALIIALSLLFGLVLLGPTLAETTISSWYGPGFHGRRTASGERFNQEAMTCASRRHRMGTRLRVTNLRNGRHAVCRVNDVGPAAWTGRGLDVSKGMARRLGMLQSGTARVSIVVLR